MYVERERRGNGGGADVSEQRAYSRASGTGKGRGGGGVQSAAGARNAPKPVCKATSGLVGRSRTSWGRCSGSTSRGAQRRSPTSSASRPPSPAPARASRPSGARPPPRHWPNGGGWCKMVQDGARLSKTVASSARMHPAPPAPAVLQNATALRGRERPLRWSHFGKGLSVGAIRRRSPPARHRTLLATRRATLAQDLAALGAAAETLLGAAPPQGAPEWAWALKLLDAARAGPPPLPPFVLSGHVASLTPY